MQEELIEEPILTETDDRFVVFPIAYHQIWKHYKSAHEKFWQFEEFDFSADPDGWKTLKPAEYEFLSQTVAFLATYETNLNEIIVSTFASEIKIPEARAFYGFQIAMMNIHVEVYSSIIENCILDYELKRILTNSNVKNPYTKNKMQWIRKYLRNKNEPFSTRIIALCFAESILMAGSLASIFWIEKMKICNGMTSSNKEIFRDKNMHWYFSCEIHNTLLNPCPSEILNELVGDAVEIEKEFVMKKLPTEKIGLNSNLVGQYVEFVADQVLEKLNQPKMFNTANPFDWIKFVVPNVDVVAVKVDNASRIAKNEDDEFNIDESF